MFLMIMVAACGADDAADDAADDDGPTWTACGPLSPDGVDGECATLAVPLDWNTDDARRIDVVAKRFTRASATPRDQLWIIDGGPGGTGAIFDDAGLVTLFDDAGWDVYIFGHRGTGSSTPLTCEAAVAPSSPGGALVLYEEVPGCRAALEATWSDGLAAFSGEQAARDLGAWIEATRQPATRVAIWGGSYGTYVAQRYLQAFPAGADAVILEGALDLTNRLSDQLHASEQAGERWFDACAEDAACNDRLGGAPRAAYDQALARIAAADCAPVADVSVAQWKALARALVDSELGYDARAILGALVRRVVRCGPDDAAVLERVAQGIDALAAQAAQDEGDLAINNPLLGINEVRVDLWPMTTDHAAAVALHDGLRFSSGAEWLDLAALVESWPAGPRAASADLPAPTDVPLLVLSGGLDTSTPLEWNQLAASRYPSARHVVFPWGGHGVSFEDATIECALPMFLQFISDPEAALDTSCVTARPIDFATAATAHELYVEWLGTEDLWGD